MKKFALKSGSMLKLPVKASAWYIASGVIGKAFGFLSTLLFTRLLSPDEYGELAVYMSWLGIGECCVSAFLSGSVIYRGLSDFKKQKQEFISTASGTFLAFSLIVCTLLFAFYAFGGFPVTLFPFLVLQILFDGIITIGLLCKKHAYSYKAVAFTNLIESAVSIFISFLLIRYAKLGFVGRVIGFLLPSLFISLFFLIRSGVPQIKRKYLFYLLPRVLPLVPGAIVLAVTAQVDKLIINGTMSTASAAKYSVIHSVGACGLFLVGSLFSALSPWLTRKLSAAKFAEISEIARTVLTAFSAISLFIIAAAPLAVGFLAPREYAEALPALAPISLSIIPYFASNLNTAHLIFLYRSGLASKTSIISGIIGIASSFLLIPLLGYFGAGLSVLISSTASFLCSNCYLKRLGAYEILPKSLVSSRLALASVLALGFYLSYGAPYIIPLILIFPACSLLTSALSAKQIIFE